ncbi:helix-turn-helix domain-containing protein [Yoonia sp. R2-816]|uniref:helix-turn-helix domain-containing protein n=1 Tax=Yoonia sp. R2-816 TaxID=3342638 RepID=UPI00372ADD28
MKNASTASFGKILQKARSTKGLSLDQGAELLGVPKTTLWRWESGETKVHAHRLVDIAAAYSLSVSAIFEGETVTAPTHTDFERLGIVVEHIERIIQQLGSRPEPKAVRTAVVEVLRLETTRVFETTDSEFDPSRYNGLVEGILGKTR